MHLTFVLGTRPEIIKLSSVLSACVRDATPFTLIHTNQHYDPAMDACFFEELGLPAPDHHLGVGSGSHSQQIAKMIVGVESVLQRCETDRVIVQGDTNSALAGGLAARKLGVPVAHVEAGLRSFDPHMPEEANRILLDHLSSDWFCPAPLQVELLRREGIQGPRVHLTGNTGNDATLAYAPRARERVAHRRNGVLAEGYLLLTCHRPANTDDLERFAMLLGACDDIARGLGLRVLFPTHPRLGSAHRATIARFSRIAPLPPVGYLDMLSLIDGATLVLTDSGGVQEESCALRRKCLILRENTERPETLAVGGAQLPERLEREALLCAADQLMARHVEWYNPFGDGQAYRRILDALTPRAEAAHPQTGAARA